ncbi:MAG: Gfo/Idh/MocA family oxidoreductase [Victivallaceae bacterium]|nr:Gfo/Idh/MocA family oxidoreductase [Victivallaceae bacterium]
MSSKKKMRVAVIGCGMIYEEHMEAYACLSDSVEVVAAVDIKPDRLDVMERDWKIPRSRLYTDWKKMLAEVKPDGVDICLPNYLHCPAAVDAFAAGCHVMVEKPMALNVAECEVMMKAAQKAGKILGVGFQLEHSPSTNVIINAREDGFFGRMQLVEGRLLRRCGTPNWGIYYSRELGGGPIMDIAVHLIDMVTYTIGRPKVTRISAGFFEGKGKKKFDAVCEFPDWNYKEYDVEDLAAAQIYFDNGIIFQLETSYFFNMKENVVYEFKLTGEDGGLYWRNNQIPEFYCNRYGAMMDMTPAWLPPIGRPVQFKNKLDNWVKAVQDGTPLLVTAQDALYVQGILDGIRESATTKKEVIF